MPEFVVKLASEFKPGCRIARFGASNEMRNNARIRMARMLPGDSLGAHFVCSNNSPTYRHTWCIGAIVDLVQSC